MKQVGVLISGRGSNLGSLIEACARKGFPASIVIVISNRADAAGLEIAQAAGIQSLVIDHKSFDTREDFETALNDALLAADVDLVCNAGFMRLLTDQFVQKWFNRQLNIHPSLLPAYKGIHIHERVIDDGVRITGCSVHFVRTAMDSGPIIAQAAVPVISDDTPDSLAVRVLAAEHKIYPLALELVAADKVRVSGDKVIIDDGGVKIGGLDTLFVPPL